MGWVKVKSKVQVVDRYDGIQYTFPAGKALVVPESVARHVFGWPDDQRAAIVRRGLNRDPEAAAIFVATEIAVCGAPPDAPEPGDTSKRKRAHAAAELTDEPGAVPNEGS